MKFIADLDYNNNGWFFGSFVSKAVSSNYSNNVLITGDGVTLFHLNRAWKIPEKIAFVTVLDKKLAENFSNGLDAVTCANSDCVTIRKLRPFYEVVKKENPKIKTIFCGGGVVEDETGAEIFIEAYRNAADLVCRILDPTAEDKVKPMVGWLEREIFLLQLFMNAQKEVEKNLGSQFPGPRPDAEDGTFLELIRRNYERKARLQQG